MSACSRCGSLPRPVESSGTLFLAPPLAHTQSQLVRALRDRKIPFGEPATQILSIELIPDRLAEVVTVLADCLGEIERRDTWTLILPQGMQPSLGDMHRTRPSSTLIAKVQESWLIEMIADRRLTTHFQPIVPSHSIGEVFAYECLLRGVMEDGSLIPPMRIYGAARGADLLFQVDREARLTAIRKAVDHGICEHLFINFNPSSIYDPRFCLKTTIAAIGEAGIDPDRIIFEVVESDQVEIDLLGIMNTYREAGFRIALDDLGAGYGSLNLLCDLKPDFVKLDMKLARDIDRNPYKAAIGSKLLEMAVGLGISTIAEGIETLGELQWFQDHGVDYIQGYYIARPASPPPRPTGTSSQGSASTSAAFGDVTC